jgi:hypothetical protein
MISSQVLTALGSPSHEHEFLISTAGRGFSLKRCSYCSFIGTAGGLPLNQLRMLTSSRISARNWGFEAGLGKPPWLPPWML